VKIPNPAYEARYAVDQQVLGFLLTSLSKEMLTQIIAAKTAAQAWKEIEDMFATKSRAQKINVRLALTTTRKGDMSISEYIAKMKALGDEISAAGKPIEKDELVPYIINGLDEEYEAVISANVAKNESVSVAEVHSQLLGFENRNNLRHATANSATRGGRGGDIS
jgi:hypothetical protein